MTYAISDNDELCEASPKTILRCPNCKRSVFSKCGDVRVWHWSHYVNESCEYSNIVDSVWRNEWIRKTAKEKAEKIINGQIVDVLGNNNAKVLFIDRKLEEKEIKDKESAFNDKIIWILKSDKFKYLKLYKNDYRYDQQQGHYSFTWKKPRNEWNEIEKSRSFLFFDVGSEMQFYSNSFDKEPKGIIKNRLLYIKEFRGNEYEINGRAVEMEEGYFIDRYM